MYCILCIALNLILLHTYSYYSLVRLRVLVFISSVLLLYNVLSFPLVYAWPVSSPVSRESNRVLFCVAIYLLICGGPSCGTPGARGAQVPWGLILGAVEACCRPTFRGLTACQSWSSYCRNPHSLFVVVFLLQEASQLFDAFCRGPHSQLVAVFLLQDASQPVSRGLPAAGGLTVSQSWSSCYRRPHSQLVAVFCNRMSYSQLVAVFLLHEVLQSVSRSLPAT